MSKTNLEKKFETIARRKLMSCKVYQIKLDKSRLSKKTIAHLNKLFLEAKWFYNYGVERLNNGEKLDYKCKIITIKNKEGKYEGRKLEILPAQCRLMLVERLFNSLKVLKRLKANGHIVGCLKFKSKVNSIPLYQYGCTYCLNFKNKSVFIQGMSTNTGSSGRDRHKWLKVNGLEQIPKDVEFANADLIRKIDDYYLNVVTFKEKEKIEPPNKSIGIDFGCSTQLTFSNGIKIEYAVEESKRLCRINRKTQRKKVRFSKNKEKGWNKIRKEYQKLANKRKDIRNKIVNAIKTNFKCICIQDDNIRGWTNLQGKKINSTSIGGIKEDLKLKSHTPLIVDRFFPSSQVCPLCETKTKHNLSQRIFVCSNCNYTEDRDLKSAICIETEGLKQIVPTDRRELIHKSYESTPEEILTSTFYNTLMKIDGIVVRYVGSLNQEAQHLISV